MILDPWAAAAFIGVLSSALSAEQVQKGRSLLADLVGEQVGADRLTLVDDGRLEEGPAAAPFDDEGVPTGRTELIDGGVLRGFLHNARTAKRDGTRSTGNASRPSYRGVPGVSPSNLYVEPGTEALDALLARAAGGVYVQEVSGVHSGANPVSGEFSVGADGAPDRRRRAGRAAAGDDHRQHPPRGPEVDRGDRLRPPVPGRRDRHPAAPDRRDDGRGNLTFSGSATSTRA